MSEFLKSEISPDDPEDLPPARRRRAQRLVAPLDADSRAAFLDRLAQRAAPSLDFFLFSLLSGIVLGLGLALDRPALLVLGAIFAPTMAPVIGVALGTTIGSGRYFLRNLAGFLVGSVFVFAIGALAGGAVQSGILPMQPHNLMARVHTQISWVQITVVVIGAVWTASALARNGNRAQLPGVALAYGIYVPLASTGFGLTVGQPHLWPDGLLVFALHFAIAVLVGAVTLAIWGYRPLTAVGYTLGGVVLLAGVMIALAVAGMGIAVGGQIAIPTFTATHTLTPTVTPTLTSTPVPPTSTLTPSIAPSVTNTLTPSPVPPTSTPTPVFALVAVEGDTGGRIRAEPDGLTLGVLRNGTVVQVLPEVVELGGQVWVHVLTPEGLEGWMVQSLLATATPPPDWNP